MGKYRILNVHKCGHIRPNMNSVKYEHVPDWFDFFFGIECMDCQPSSWTWAPTWRSYYAQEEARKVD